MNSSLASLNNANVVDNNSIQSQFAQLTRERDELRYGCSTAERELHRENEQVNQIRQKQTRLADEIRVAHAAVGEVSKKRKMVLDDIKHLKVNIECDKAKTLEITVRIDHLEAEETNRKVMFVKEMDALNDELEAVLSEHEELITLRMITPHSIDYLLKKTQNSQHSDTSLQIDVRHGLDNLTKAANMCDEALKEKTRLEKNIQDLRMKALGKKINQEGSDHQNPAGIGEIELDELERIWEDQGLDQTNDQEEKGRDQTSNNIVVQPVNMDLFYGSSYQKNSHFDANKPSQGGEVITT